MKHPPFRPQALTAEQQLQVEGVRLAFEQAASEVERHCPAGRYRALAMTELEASCMWAIKAISHETPERFDIERRD